MKLVVSYPDESFLERAEEAWLRFVEQVQPPPVEVTDIYWGPAPQPPADTMAQAEVVQDLPHDPRLILRLSVEFFRLNPSSQMVTLLHETIRMKLELTGKRVQRADDLSQGHFQGKTRSEQALDDGSRVAITVRRFGTRSFSAAQLVAQGALPENIRHAAERTLHTRRNILVSGGTGSGKTTLLNALIALIPDDERIVAIEDTLELRIDSPNCVRFEARGVREGAVTIRDLVKHALRHRPDHIVVGEVRGGEAADLLQALNTGHGGSLTTVHANNAESALSRLASCAMQGGGDLPWDVTCRGVVDGIAMVIHMTRADGRRVVEEAAMVTGYDAGRNAWDMQRLDRVTVQGRGAPAGQRRADRRDPHP